MNFQTHNLDISRSEILETSFKSLSPPNLSQTLEHHIISYCHRLFAAEDDDKRLYRPCGEICLAQTLLPYNNSPEEIKKHQAVLCKLFPCTDGYFRLLSNNMHELKPGILQV